MSFIDNEEVKSALLAHIKANILITAELPSSEEVREVQYQGTTFAYPNVRIRIISNEPVGNTGCHHRIQLGIQVNSEKLTSKEVEEISGIIGEELNDTSFSQDGVNFILRITNLVPALRVDERTWRSEVLMIGIVS